MITPVKALWITYFIYVVAEGLTASLAAAWWTRLSPVGRWAAAWIFTAFAATVLGYITRYTVQNSLVVSFFWFPVSAWLACGAMAAIHGPGRSSRAIRVASWLYILAWAILSATVEELGNYSRFTASLHSLIMAGIAAYTLVSRVEASRQDLVRDPGFLLSTAWLIYAIPTVFVEPAARAWLRSGDYDQIVVFFIFRNWIVIGSFVVLVLGLYRSRGSRAAPVAAATGDAT